MEPKLEAQALPVASSSCLIISDREKSMKNNIREINIYSVAGGYDVQFT